MSAITTKTRKPSVRKARSAKRGLSLPRSTSAIEVEGKRYLLTPEADMTEWLEDLEDILDSRAAMEEAGESIPFAAVVKELKLKLPARRK
jgi:hypothetical protein